MIIHYQDFLSKTEVRFSRFAQLIFTKVSIEKFPMKRTMVEVAGLRFLLWALAVPGPHRRAERA